ncbi:MAG: hypothetical protein PHQ52_05325, partial [Candidatus Omnitrophica bacterium]|nr:hypothetical protein [Candidatus Omnitrophota bacterium]
KSVFDDSIVDRLRNRYREDFQEYTMTQDTRVIEAVKHQYHQLNPTTIEQGVSEYSIFLAPENFDQVRENAPEEDHIRWTTSQDYYLPYDFRGRRVITRLENSIVFPVHFDGEGQAMHSFEMGIDSLDIVREYVTSKGITFEDIINDFPEQINDDQRIQKLIKAIRENFSISEVTEMSVVDEITWVRTTTDDGEAYIGPSTNPNMNTRQIKIPDDPYGRDIMVISPAKYEDQEGRTVIFNMWWEADTSNAPRGVVPGTAEFYNYKGSILSDRSTFSRDIQAYMVDERIDGERIKYLLWLPSRETENIEGLRSVHGYVYDTVSDKFQTGVAVTIDGSTAISMFDQQYSRMANSLFSDLKYGFGLPENTSIATSGKELVIQNLSDINYRSLISVNDKGYITNITIEEIYSVEGQGEQQKQITEAITLTVRPFTLSLEQRSMSDLRQDISRVLDIVYKGKEKGLSPSQIALALKQYFAHGTGALYDVIYHRYENGVEQTALMQRMDNFEGAKQQIIKITAIVSVVLVILFALGRFLRGRQKREFKKKTPIIGGTGEGEGSDQGTSISVSSEGTVSVQAIEDMVISTLSSYGFDKDTTSATATRILYNINSRLVTGEAFEDILKSEFVEFLEWHTSYGESVLKNVYTQTELLNMLILKQLCYTYATKFKSSTSNFVYYLFDYGLANMADMPEITVSVNIGQIIIKEEAVWFNAMKKWSIGDDKKLKADVITIENMNKLLQNRTFLGDYRIQRKANNESQFLLSLTKAEIIKKYGIYHDRQGGFFNIVGAYYFFKTQMYTILSLTSAGLLCFSLLSWLIHPAVNSIVVSINPMYTFVPGILLLMIGTITAKGKFFTDIYKAFKSPDKDIRNNMLISLAHIGTTVILWALWNYFISIHLAVPLLHMVTGAFNPNTGMFLYSFVTFLLVYIPAFMLSKPGNKDLTTRVEKRIDKIGSAPKIKAMINWMTSVPVLNFLFIGKSKQFISSLVKALVVWAFAFLIPGFFVPQQMYVLLFLLPFALFIPLSYFSAYYQVQGIFGFLYGEYIGLGKYTGLKNFKTSLAEAKKAMLEKAPFGEEGWTIIWDSIVDNLYYEDKITKQTRDALKQGDIGDLKNNEEAQKRILMTLKGFSMDFPAITSWEEIPSQSMVFTSAGEPIAFYFDQGGAEFDLNYKHDTGYTKLTYLIKQHKQEWDIFLQRLQDLFGDDVNDFCEYVRDIEGWDTLSIKGTSVSVIKNGEERRFDIAQLRDVSGPDSLTNNMDFAEMLGFWANMRFTGLYRSIYGFVSTRKAYKVYAKACGIADADIEKEVDSKLQVVMDMQTFQSEKEFAKKQVYRLMELNPYLELDYIGTIDGLPHNMLDKYNTQTGQVETIEKVPWPDTANRWGLMLHTISKYKCENQDNYVPFLKGKYVFFADGTSAARVEDVFRQIHSLMEFENDDNLKLMVYREYLFSDTNNWTAECIAYADWVWSTITQRNLHMMGAQGFYGHSGIVP